MNTTKPTIQIAGSTILAALAVIFQILPPIFVTPWSMRIDLVAIPWILCWIIFGLKPAILSMLISAPLVGFLGSFAGGWVGAVMKSVATVWMVIIPAIFSWKLGGTGYLIKNKKYFLLASIISIIARAIVTDPVIIVADEPTGDLDRTSAEEILTLMERLNKEFKKTIVMVTHDPHAAEKAHITRNLDKGDLV